MVLTMLGRVSETGKGMSQRKVFYSFHFGGQHMSHLKTHPDIQMSLNEGHVILEEMVIIICVLHMRLLSCYNTVLN